MKTLLLTQEQVSSLSNMKDVIQAVEDGYKAYNSGKGSVVEASWVKPGTHVICIGTDMDGKQEVDSELFRKATIIVDAKNQAVSRGETHVAIKNGVITEEDVTGEIGEICLGKLPGRTSDEEITLFDSTGMAIQDNVMAASVYRNAVKQGIGTEFEFFK